MRAKQEMARIEKTMHKTKETLKYFCSLPKPKAPPTTPSHLSASASVSVSVSLPNPVCLACCLSPGGLSYPQAQLPTYLAYLTDLTDTHASNKAAKCMHIQDNSQVCGGAWEGGRCKTLRLIKMNRFYRASISCAHAKAHIRTLIHSLIHSFTHSLVD